MYFYFNMLFLISFTFGVNHFPSSFFNNSFINNNQINIPDTLRLVGIMAQFQKEVIDNPKTSGDGNFLNLNSDQYNRFYETDQKRCDGFLVDRPPHDSLYFQKQLEAVGNYYKNISNNNLFYRSKIITNPIDIDGYYTVENGMEYYSKSDKLLAQFFTEVLNLAKDDIEKYFYNEIQGILPDDVIFIVFHAGISQDFSYPTFDPTIYDLKSAYIDEQMINDIEPAEIDSACREFFRE